MLLGLNGLNSCNILKQWWGYMHLLLTNVMKKKGTMAAHTLSLTSPDVRRWNLKQTIPVFLMLCI